jgi:hypothetical protein
MLAAGLTLSAHAGENYRAWTGPNLLMRWAVLNNQCRGGSGDDPATKRACDERNLVDAALYAHGYCYVGNSGFQQRWEMGPPSRWTSRGEQAVCQ